MRGKDGNVKNTFRPQTRQIPRMNSKAFGPEHPWAKYELAALKRLLRMAIWANAFGMEISIFSVWQFSPFFLMQYGNSLQSAWQFLLFSFLRLAIIHVAIMQILENTWELLCCSMTLFWQSLIQHDNFYFRNEKFFYNSMTTLYIFMAILERSPEVVFF